MIMLSTIASAASGKLGGLVFVQGGGGIIVRAWKKPTNPNSEAQQEVRSIFASLSNAWSNDLTGTQRSRWNLYASVVKVRNRLGEEINISGFNMFMRTNTVARYNGVPDIEDGPLTLTLADEDNTMAGSISEATQLVSVTFDDAKPWVSEDDACMQIQVSRPASSGVFFVPPTYQLAGTILGSSGTPLTSPQTFAIPFPMDAGNKFQVAGRILRADGRLSGKFQDKGVAAP